MIKLIKNKRMRLAARFLLLLMIFEIVQPLGSYALTSGPSQPEMQSFEPVGTSDLVNLFSGDFNYNIPLLDVEGYPVNIAYQSGSGIEQEASWVGLGWNLNVGNINHIVRGLPDDFDGDYIEKELDMADEVTTTVSINAKAEIVGKELDSEKLKKVLKKFNVPSVNVDYNVNNYSGVSASIGKGIEIRSPKLGMAANINFSKSTNNGSELDYSFYKKQDQSESTKKLQASMGTSVTGGLNSREGAKQMAFNINPSIPIVGNLFNAGTSHSFVPIGIQNYYPSFTNRSYSSGKLFGFNVSGLELKWGNAGVGVSAMRNTVKHERIGTRKAYGYFNLENAGEEDITDFGRDKDGVFNNFSQYLPTSNLTYDIYSVNGQGTGGTFRAFRNSIGTINDPKIDKTGENQQHSGSYAKGDLFAVGYDFNITNSTSEAGAWPSYKRSFSGKVKGNLAEPYYFKQAGELTLKDPLISTVDAEDAKDAYSNYAGAVNNRRTKRSSLLYFLTPSEAALNQISTTPKLENYKGVDFGALPTSPDIKDANGQFDYQKFKEHYTLDRPDANNVNSKKASEFVQVQPNGQRYIFGLPVMNNKQIDYEVSTEGTPVNGLVDISYANNEPVAPNGTGDHLVQKFISKKSTPPYAHSYQLTAILSPDYVDVTGNGLTDDDLGNYTKFNYSKQEANYVWRTPYQKDKAYYNQGLKSDCKDDKANFSIGEREVWMLHSIETRNYIAEFSVSERADAQASDENGILGVAQAKSYKLDKIVLYNKKERLGANPQAAVPIKTILFSYDYKLCQGIENSSNGKGKLTLRAIYTKYGNSDIGYLSPYKFQYGVGITNPSYQQLAKDAWGNYKPVAANSNSSQLDLNNQDFPYTDQNCSESDANERVSAWSLEKIFLPSGGSIQVEYESDDYAYVQDKKAMEMFKLEGIGPNKNFVSGNSLYGSLKDPYCFLFFKRKKSLELSNSLWESYLSNEKLIQYNLEVLFGEKNTLSCPNKDLYERIKGYARVLGVGYCDNDPNSDYGYIHIEPKKPKTAFGINQQAQYASVNPITFSALNFARYYSTKLLYPESDIPNLSNGANVSALMKILLPKYGKIIEMARNPIKDLVRSGKARKCDLSKSYIRLISQGLKKRGGGSRVKEVIFSDSWVGGTTNTYGQEYDYTMIDPISEQSISSGVASYEPMLGGDENPHRTLLYSLQTSREKQFPPSDPINLLQEGPIAESFYPNATVGYSKVSVKSIHQDKGASVQSLSVHEFYTAKDFPVIVDATKIKKNPEDGKPPTKRGIFFTKNELEASQGYSVIMNDMHGKPKKQSAHLISGGVVSSAPESYTAYTYFTEGNRLKNEVPCIVPNGYMGSNVGNLGTGAKEVLLTLGEEIDMSIDSRSNEQTTNNFGTQLNVNVSELSGAPTPIPSVFLKFKQKQENFHSVCATKIVQRYGIIKAVETLNKGAKVTVENELFDPNTGDVLSTKVNTEHNDHEYSMKYPAYWAYKNMEHASDNILYEEDIVDNCPVINSEVFLKLKDIGKVNIGDELLLTGRACDNVAGNLAGIEKINKYKLWITDKGVNSPGIVTGPCTSAICNDPDLMPGNIAYYDSENPNSSCLSFNDLMSTLYDITNNSFFNSNIRHPEYVSINRLPLDFQFITQLNSNTLLGLPRYLKATVPFNASYSTGRENLFKAEVGNSYSSSNPPYSSSHFTVVSIIVKAKFFHAGGTPGFVIANNSPYLSLNNEKDFYKLS